MAAFCGACGAPAGRPGQAYCIQCGAGLAAPASRSDDPRTPSATPRTGEEQTHPGLSTDPWSATRPHQGALGSPPAGAPYGSAVLIDERRRAAQPVRGWEVAAFWLIGLAWLGAAAWWGVALAVALVRGEQLGVARVMPAAVVWLLPPVAIAAFFIARQAGLGGWRWALPMLVAVPLLVLGIRAIAPESAAGPASASGQSAPAPGATPTPAPTQPGGLPIPLPTNLPFPIPLPTNISLPNFPLPDRNATPVPGARLTAEDARRLVKDSFGGRCLGLHIASDLARVTFEAPNWVVTTNRGETWRVADGSGAVTPDEKATARQQRQCQSGR